MATYQLFGQKISFSDAAERYYDMIHRATYAAAHAALEFEDWYEKKGDILSVLNGSEDIIGTLIIRHASRPLFEELVSYGIYDISREKYIDKCMVVDKSIDAVDTIGEKYNEIIAEQEAEVQYRADRKAGRARVVGGGFGVDGALKGMATAGAMNAASGIGHSIFNAIGNAGSAIAAASSKRALYKNEGTLALFKDAISSDIFDCYFEHIDFVNTRIKSYYSFVFSPDKGKALLESAKKVADKRTELLAESFRYFPWNKDLFIYSFRECKSERANIWKVASRFNVDLSETAEELFSAAYTSEAKENEALAQSVRKDILAQMTEIGIPFSDTVDRIETEWVTKLLKAYHVEGTDKNQLFAALDEYDASLPNKQKVIHTMQIWELTQKYDIQYTKEEKEEILNDHFTAKDRKSEATALQARPILLQIMETLDVPECKALDRLETFCLDSLCAGYEEADEATCNELKKKIEVYEASDKTKDIYLKKMQTRIEAVWAKEDGEIFDNIYLNTNIHNPEDVARSIAYIQRKSRTTDAQKYIDALNACNPTEIGKARRSQSGFMKFLNFCGFMGICSGVACLILGAGWLISLIIVALGICLVVWYSNLSDAYKILTIGGTLQHPLLLLSPSQAAAMSKVPGSNSFDLDP